MNASRTFETYNNYDFRVDKPSKLISDHVVIYSFPASDKIKHKSLVIISGTAMLIPLFRMGSGGKLIVAVVYLVSVIA